MMYRSTKQMFFFLFLAGLVVVCRAEQVQRLYSSQPKQSKTLDKPVVSTFKRFEENAPTLVKIFQLVSEVLLVLAWTVDSGLNILLWIIDEAVTSSSSLALGIFSALFHVVKLLEAFGFGVKFVLEMNYTMVSYLLDMANVLKDNVHHAMTLVKITLANETEHVYESSSMALEGVQSLLLTTCHRTWIAFWLAWEKVQFFALSFINNLTAFFRLFVPNVTIIASTATAAFHFFLESIVITAGVVSDGIIYLSKYIAATVVCLGTRSLANILLIFNRVLTVAAMVANHVIFVMTWPIYFLARLVGQITYFLCNCWEMFVTQASLLDQSAREVMSYAFYSLFQLMSTLMSQTAMFVTTYMPGGIAGLCVTTLAVLGALFWGKDVMLHLRLAWVSWRTANVEVHDGIAGDVLENDHEELTENDNEELAVNENDEGPEMGETERPTGQQKWRYELEKEKDKRLCVICQDKVKNILLLPCRHVCLCQRCLQDIKHGRVHLIKCPLCRHDIQSTMEVFV